MDFERVRVDYWHNVFFFMPVIFVIWVCIVLFFVVLTIVALVYGCHLVCGFLCKTFYLIV